MITREQVEELRKYVETWGRLIQPHATECLDTIDALWAVAEAAKIHNKHCTDINNGDLYMTLAALNERTRT